MCSAKRRFDPGVIQQFLDEPYRFEFFQAVRMLELYFSQQGRGPRESRGRIEDILPYRLAFKNSLSLAFPASEIAGAVARDDDGQTLRESGPRADAVRDGTLAEVDMTPAFFGLLGNLGVLPHHYTETVAAREHQHRDRAARAFFDIFSNRATALFYSAWKKYRLPIHYELDRNRRYLPLLMSLAGVGDASQRELLESGEGRIFDEAVAGYAAASRHRPVSAAYLERVLSEYFGVTVCVEQFVGKWYAVPPQQLSCLGRANAVLGATALAGDSVWQRDLRVRLWIGPLALEDYEAFLPGAERALALEKMLTLLSGVTLEYEVKLILRREDVGTSQLGAQGRLGWDAFVCSEPSAEDRSDACYELHTIH